MNNRTALHELNAIVRNTETARNAEAAGQLTFLPTGDGMAMVFSGAEEEPVECALEITQSLRAKPSLPLRMGIHSGSVHHVADVNQRVNIAGAGINIAQLIMDCGDAGHILVSKRVADDLAQSRRWQPYLHDLGDVEVKHGMSVSVVNFYADIVGNPAPPKKFQQTREEIASSAHRGKRFPILVAVSVAAFLLFALAIVAIIFAPAILREARSRAPASPSAASASNVAPEKSIAVLPFESLSDDKRNSFFADGVQDEILTNLAKVAELKVISRTSVMQYKNAATRNLREIGQLLGVAHVLEGSVQRVANKVRVNAQLIDARNDAHLWAQTYDRDLADVFAIQSEIAEAIQPDAGEVHWMKGLYAYHGFRDYDRALAELNLATQLLPNEARLYMVIGSVDRRTARWKEADANFKRAVELDPRNFVVLMEAGSTFQGMRRYAEARRLYEQALSILPNDPFVSYLLGFNSFAQTADTTEWRKPLQLIAQQGPEAARCVAFPLLVCSWMQRDKREVENALALIPPEGIANSIDEAFVPREFCVGRTAWLFGNKEVAQTALTAARSIFERMTREQPDYAQGWSYLGLTDAMLGRCDEAVQEGKRACEILPFTKDSWVGSIWITNLAAIYTRCGDRGGALEQLEKSVKLPTGITYGELKKSPDWDALRGDSRFQKLVASLAPKDTSSK